MAVEHSSRARRAGGDAGRPGALCPRWSPPRGPSSGSRTSSCPCRFFSAGPSSTPGGWCLAAAGFVVFSCIASGDLHRQRRHGPGAGPRPPESSGTGRSPRAGSGRVDGAVARPSPWRSPASLAAFLLRRRFRAVVPRLRGPDGRLLAAAEADPVPRGADRGGGDAAAGARGRGAGGRRGLALPHGLRVPAGALPRRRASGSGSSTTPGQRSSAEHRPALAAYRAEGLDYLFIVTALTTVAAYSRLQRLARDARRTMAGSRSPPTVPFVVLGIARYVRLVYRRGGGGNPTQALLVDDPWLLVDRHRLGGNSGMDHLWPLIGKSEG